MVATRKQKIRLDQEATLVAERVQELESGQESGEEPCAAEPVESELSSEDSMVEEIPVLGFARKKSIVPCRVVGKRRVKNRPGQGRPVLGPKDCHKCGANFNDSGELRNHDKYHCRNKMVKCLLPASAYLPSLEPIYKNKKQVCGHMMITDDTESCPGKLAKIVIFSTF